MRAQDRLVQVRLDRPEVRAIGHKKVACVNFNGEPNVLRTGNSYGENRTQRYLIPLSNNEKAKFTSMAALLAIPLSELIRRGTSSYCRALEAAFHLKWNVETGEYEEVGDYDAYDDKVRPIGMARADLDKAGMRPRQIRHGGSRRSEWVWEKDEPDS